ncbi:glycosyltransferase family 2 protein [Sphingomonas qomolangmaensis]|uniref:Glycosyltransferase n=1 Tax=Sphingomonas qomolangmaensis TaxID=2918765 RepID=A0ABY5L8A5_9SPHN|nr:glycosyltransferase family 2 protein [Sphingomonas qomolangmaensis]UUL82386.1 glycosyltransferase [Sphingomonas qomolangmaensis]
MSFAIACYNAGEYLAPAVASALAQTGVSVEVLIVDDGSTDGSVAVAEGLARADARVRLFRTKTNSGPAGARNIALAEMRGSWFAVLDADDLILPNRSRTLIDLAERESADFVADNLTVFGKDVVEKPFLSHPISKGWRRLTLDTYFAQSRLLSDTPNPGFLKPMVRRRVIEAAALRYNERLMIGEDDELVVRLLASGYTYFVLNMPLYRYRKHGASISHRLSLDHAERMMAAEHRIRDLIGPELAARPSYYGRWLAMVRGLAFTRSIDLLKRRRPLAAALALLREPAAIPLYREPLMSALRQLIRRAKLR